MFTILHLSDLHRSPTDPISNTELLSSLVADGTKHASEHPSGSPPDAIVVSGDIIQGVGLGVPDAESLIEEQYAVATEFLTALANRFLEGDRGRIVMIPGNHDVDWNAAYSAMTPAEDAELPESLGASVFSFPTMLRWSWSERQAYRIVDRSAYENRLSAFRNFYSNFYEGTARRLARERHEYFDLFELHGGRIVVAGFNSCAGNDCYCLGGHIPEDAIANAHLTLLERGKAAELRIAVWHHNIEGPPTHGDYMDIDAVNRMIGVGFRFGLHGHQHRAQMSQRIIQLPEEERMAVVSAGSLCAGPIDLPKGVNRQYNLIQFNDDLSEARVHVREMAVATVFGPATRAELGGKGYVDLSWDNESFRRHANAAIASGTVNRVTSAEKAWKEGRLAEAKDILLGFGASPTKYQRSLLLRVLGDDGDWDQLVVQIGDPQDISELTQLVRAEVARQEFGSAREALDRWAGPLNLPEPQRADLNAMITAKELLNPQ